MVGVPKSRGCLACRKQKKKCNGDTAPCLRCANLGILCTGFGERRLKFQDEGYKFMVVRKNALSAPTSTAAKHPPKCPGQLQDTVGIPTSVPASLSNASSRLIAEFARGIDPMEDTSVQLPWNFGPFLEDIPRHLGLNDSLDAAADALVAAYGQFRTTGRATNELGLRKYSRALRTLRDCLAEPHKACMTETLCAIMILIVFETLLGISDDGSMKHAGGAAKIFKYRGNLHPESELEQKLLLSLRGPVIIQALFIDKPYFTLSEWSLIAESDIGADSIEEEAFRGLGETVWLFQSARNAFSMQRLDQNQIADLDLRTSFLRERMKKVMVRFAPRFEALQAAMDSSPNCRWTRIAHAACARSFGMAMATLILINAILDALCGRRPDGGVLEQDNARLCEDICTLADQVSPHRPLGTIYVPFVLRIAYVGADGDEARARVCGVLLDYCGDFMGERAVVNVEELEWLVRYLTLRHLTGV